MRETYSRSGDNAKMKPFTFARNEDDLTDNSRTPTGTKIYFRSPSPSPSQNSLVLKFPNGPPPNPIGFPLGTLSAINLEDEAQVESDPTKLISDGPSSDAVDFDSKN